MRFGAVRLMLLASAYTLACGGRSQLDWKREENGVGGARGGATSTAFGGTGGGASGGTAMPASGGIPSAGGAATVPNGGRAQGGRLNTAGESIGSAGVPVAAGGSGGRPPDGPALALPECGGADLLRDSASRQLRPNELYGSVNGDWNEDGHLDFAFVSHDLRLVSVLGRGDGTFEPPLDGPALGVGRLYPAGDVNVDGHPDLALRTGENDVLLLQGEGDGSFVAHWTGLRTRGGMLEFADYDLDGRLDVAMLNTDRGAVAIALGNGDGTFQHDIRYYALQAAPIEFVAADLDADGDHDLVVVNGTVTPLLNDGKGNFSVSEPVLLVEPASRIAAADLDGDGNIDFVVGAFCDRRGQPDGDAYILLGRGDGSLEQPAPVELETVCSMPVVAGDLNGDGATDLTFDGRAQLGRGGLVFEAGPTLPSLETGPFGDFNEDGKLDVLGVSEAGAWLLAGTGDGSFAEVPLDIGVRERALVAEGLDGTTAFAVELLDYPEEFDTLPWRAGHLDNDGHLDFLSVSRQPGLGLRLTARLGTGDRRLKPATSQTLRLQDRFGEVTGWAFGDLNGDTIPDMVISGDGFGSGSPDAMVSVLLGQGNGLFEPFVSRTIALSSTTMVDVNGDGNLDLVGTDGASVSLLLGAGDGRFKERLDLAREPFPGALVLADFNRDGRIDLATAESDGTRLSVLLGRGNGTFEPARAYFLLTTTSDLAAGDLDGDGNTDLVYVQGLSGVGVLLGDGNGGFNCSRSFSVHSAVNTVALGDIDRDGALDVVTRSADGYRVLLNQN